MLLNLVGIVGREQGKVCVVVTEKAVTIGQPYMI